MIARLKFRFSRAGLLVAGLFLAAAFGVFGWLMYSAATNPADSGEAGVLLLPFAMPWVDWLPRVWLGPWVAFGCIFLNALILYLVFGGLRFRRAREQ